MMPSRLVHALAIAPLVIGGCYAKQPTYDDIIEEATSKSDGEADHYFLLPRNGSTFKSLSKGKQAELNDLWRQYHKELGEGGGISGDTRNWIDRTDAECRTALVVSFDQVTANPTPEMNGQLESFDSRRRNDAMIENENLRALADEWSRFWLMDRPGGTPYNTVNTSGRF